MRTATIDVQKLIRLWREKTPVEEMCRELDISFARLRVLARRFDLPGHQKLKAVLPVAPDEADVAAQAAALRQRWSKTKTKSRGPSETISALAKMATKRHY